MSSWVTVLAQPIEPVETQADPAMGAPEGLPVPEFFQVRAQKDEAKEVDGVRVTCEWLGAGLPEGTTKISIMYEIEQTTILRSPVGTVLHTFAPIGPLEGDVVVKIDLYGGLQAILHYPTLTTPYRLDML